MDEAALKEKTKAAIIQLVEQDSRRQLRYIKRPVAEGKRVWVCAIVTKEQWDLFYSSRDAPITGIISLFFYSKGEWIFSRWAVAEIEGRILTEFGDRVFGTCPELKKLDKPANLPDFMQEGDSVV